MRLGWVQIWRVLDLDLDGVRCRSNQQARQIQPALDVIYAYTWVLDPAVCLRFIRVFLVGVEDCCGEWLIRSSKRCALSLFTLSHSVVTPNIASVHRRRFLAILQDF